MFLFSILLHWFSPKKKAHRSFPVWTDAISGAGALRSGHGTKKKGAASAADIHIDFMSPIHQL